MLGLLGFFNVIVGLLMACFFLTGFYLSFFSKVLDIGLIIIEHWRNRCMVTKVYSEWVGH